MSKPPREGPESTSPTTPRTFGDLKLVLGLIDLEPYTFRRVEISGFFIDEWTRELEEFVGRELPGTKEEACYWYPDEDSEQGEET